jgi:hypothetical protein
MAWKHCRYLGGNAARITRSTCVNKQDQSIANLGARTPLDEVTSVVAGTLHGRLLIVSGSEDGTLRVGGIESRARRAE